MHLVRMIIQIGQDLLERHQKMALFKNACSHKSGNQSLFAGFLADRRTETGPGFFVTAVGADYRPAGDIYIDDLCFPFVADSKDWVSIPNGIRFWLENGDSIIYVKSKKSGEME